MDLPVAIFIIHPTRLMSPAKLQFLEKDQMAKSLRSVLAAILYPTIVCSKKRLSFEKLAKFPQKSF